MRKKVIEGLFSRGAKVRPTKGHHFRETPPAMPDEGEDAAHPERDPTEIRKVASPPMRAGATITASMAINWARRQPRATGDESGEGDAGRSGERGDMRMPT